MSEHLELLNGAYVLDAVDDVERAAVERHLRGCEPCAIEVAEFREAAARLGVAEAVAPPPDLRGRVLARARATRQSAAPALRPPARPRRLVVAAAAVAVLAGTVGTTWWVQENRVSDERARVVAARQEAERTRSVLAAPDAKLKVSTDARAGRFTAVYSAVEGAAVLSYDGLADPPAGKTYQLWEIIDGAPRSLEVLPPSARGGSRVVDGLDPVDQLAVSVENEGGAAQPTDIYATVAMN
ncbi:anti-sigma factor [Cryptosporangium aurantiacum]|uniref:Regulator of SigK n=1 Tax=Cryptosporangium aurantiacum TaxID=134849 RepID=A0A1M7M882_9ACTN|nr:anti-sigma factor [Cryptosporangium aurantiacum]SHM86960.1 Anti-sigma-K factor RskA [Cryptosporangium aurantiacum]